MRTVSLTTLAVAACAALLSSIAAARDIANEELLRRDFTAAAELLEGAADSGDTDAEYQLAALLRRGLGTSRDDQAAQEIYAELAASGYTGAALATPESARFDWLELAPDQQLSALHWAAQTGDLEELERLLTAGVDVNQRSATGSTALIRAARHGHVAAVKQLLSASALADATDVLGDTALIQAAQAGHLDSVQALIAGGADVNHTGLFGNSAVLAATKRGQVSVVELLLAAGANRELANGSDQTATSVAALSRSTAIAEALGVTRTARAQRSASASLQLDKANRDGRSIWFVAADRGDVRAMQTLLKTNPEFDQVDAQGRTALAIAAERGHVDLARVLLSVGADPQHTDRASKTPIAFAAGRPRNDVLGVLLEALDSGTAIRSPDIVFTAAIETGAAENLSMLVDGRSNVARALGVAPMNTAAQACRTDALQILLDAGADVRLADADGRSPAWFAAGNGCVDGLAILRRAGGDLTSADSAGETPLHRAAMSACTRCVKELLDAGAPVDPRDQHGWTPLMLAVTHHQFDSMYALAGAGHDLDATNDAGNTALLVSVQRGDATAVERLLVLGAKKRPVNKRRQNAKDVAEVFGHADVSDLLDRL